MIVEFPMELNCYLLQRTPFILRPEPAPNPKTFAGQNLVLVELHLAPIYLPGVLRRIKEWISKAIPIEPRMTRLNIQFHIEFLGSR